MAQQLFVEFQSRQGSSLVAVVLCAFISMFAIDFIWIRVAWSVIAPRIKKGGNATIFREQVFLRTQLGAYIASLLVSNLFSSFAFLFNITWIRQGGITLGGICGFQGALKQVGDTATAYFTAAIAVHTFSTLALRTRSPVWFCAAAICFGWVATIAGALIPSNVALKSGPLYSTDRSTCGISLAYPAVQAALHVVPIFFAAFVAALSYTLVFLIIRGTLVVSGWKFSLNLSPQPRWSSETLTSEYHGFMGAIARSMLWSPLAYVLLMLPHIIVTVMETSGKPVAFASKVFSICCAALLGAANVVIFYNTLRVMGPAFKQAAVSKGKDDIESFGNADPEKESPVEVAPPLSELSSQQDLPPKTPAKPGFTPRKLTLLTPREVAFHSFETSKGLKSARGHVPTTSNASGSSSLTAVSSITYKRSITPVAELNEMLSRQTSPHSETSSDESSTSLPVPRRERGKPRSLRRKKVPPPVLVNAPADNGFLSAVNLKTTARTPKTKEKSRKSFLNMYGFRSAEPSVAKHSRMAFGGDPTPAFTPKAFTARPPTSAVATGNQRFGSPAFGPARRASHSGSPSTPSTSSSPDVSARLDPVVALSPFMGEFIEQASQAVNSPLLEGHSRNQTDDAPLAWDTFSKNASNSPAAARSGAQIKALRRRSRSLDVKPTFKVTPALHSASAISTSADLSPRMAASPIRPLPTAPLRLGLPATPRSTKQSKRPLIQEVHVNNSTARSRPGTPQNPDYFVAV